MAASRSVCVLRLIEIEAQDACVTSASVRETKYFAKASKFLNCCNCAVVNFSSSANFATKYFLDYEQQKVLLNKIFR